MKDNLLNNLKYRLSILKYANNHSVSRASLKFNVSRTFIYKLKSRYDGTLESISPHSKRPISHPNQSTSDELDLIKRYIKRNPNVGLMTLWIKLRNAGYFRCMTTLYRSLIKLGLKTNPPKPEKNKRRNMDPTFFPGERIQIDIKYVPKDAVTDPNDFHQYYQYTAIDEYSRYRYLEIFDEMSTYNASLFLIHCIKRMPFEIKCVQTDNGITFTNKFVSKDDTLTKFQQTLADNNISHRLIRPYTPRHNGKVERSHRKDKMYFYSIKKFMNLDDLKSQLSRYLREYNNFPMQPLKFMSPNQVLAEFKVKDIKT